MNITLSDAINNRLEKWERIFKRTLVVLTVLLVYAVSIRLSYRSGYNAGGQAVYDYIMQRMESSK